MMDVTVMLLLKSMERDSKSIKTAPFLWLISYD